MPLQIPSMTPTSSLHPTRKSVFFFMLTQVAEWSQVWTTWPGSELPAASCMSSDMAAIDVFLTNACWRPRTRCLTIVDIITSGTDLTISRFVGPHVQDHCVAVCRIIKLWFYLLIFKFWRRASGKPRRS